LTVNYEPEFIFIYDACQIVFDLKMIENSFSCNLLFIV